ncbi:MAG TPA: S46 family peptidase [Bryobacteraceae bacterium]|nr:S46 family peptidase [Bryobacteraceae bacterium]
MRFALLISVCLLAVPGSADEGLWPYNQFPRDTVKQKYGFDVSEDFLGRLRMASVKIGDGSGAFVSPQGLLLTSRQVAGPCLAALSSSGHDFFNDGFMTAERSGELPCPGLTADVLLRIQDVTAQVKQSGESMERRNAAIGRIEKECRTGNVCTVVRLFSGGRYDLYEYRRYRDVRLVFAPEYLAAFFGREHDSVSYLRYGLNVAFFRAYENGRPAATPGYLKWSAEGVREGDLVFLAGNPGPTGRLSTAAQLAFYRDTSLPLLLARLQPRIQQLNAFAAAGKENQRAAQAVLGGLLTLYKSEAGKLIGLRDDRLVTRKTAFEAKVRRVVEGNSKVGAEAGKVWDEVASAYKKWTPLEKPYQILEGFPAPGSRLFRIARQIVRGGAVDDSEPVNEALETMMLARYLDELRGLGEKEAPVKALLGNGTAQEAAEKMVKSTRLKDPVERRRMAADRAAALASRDPLLALASALEPAAQRLARQHQETIGTLEATAMDKIAQYRLRLFGAADYPDGTSSPRVEFGMVKGYTDRAAVPQPFASTFGGMFYRKDNDGPWQAPQRWIDAMRGLDPVTPLDFVSTSDIGGGDYGSPVVNRQGELVGVTFDGNLESLPVTYLYSDEQARAVHVDVRGIVEALSRIYRATGLLDELGVRPAGL